ncbi:MAG: putative histidine kinase, classic [Nocardioides sp.]|jgi:PAS domain S-box-containing protein|uniref:sensor histidine kinase n=1 Tax=Nocardioides sp. TaxID=35761 RepID=UPI002608BB02|nr:PAS domain-containing sensor histidine kinase [Nocardioides sp.]MCW2834480.1 putative histidine kinase, classic [Nocardioides sp.]
MSADTSAVPEAAASSRAAPFARDPGLLSQIVEVSGDAIFSEDRAGIITSWNAAAERIYGCAAEEMVGRPTAELLPEETSLQLQSVHELALSGERVDRFDTWHLRPDGRHIAVSLTVSPLRDRGGEIAGLATSVQDVTDRVQLTAELEDARRTQEKQNVALARSNRDLEQFAFVASHDLSEPLRAMTGFVQLLEKRYANELDERGLGYIAHVVDGSNRMRTLIDDLLEYSRYLLVDPPGRVIKTAEAAREVAASLQLTGVHVGEVPDVWYDETSVLAVLYNLIGNANKFRRPEVPLRVEVTGRIEDGRVLVCVDDNGIGIEPQYRDRVFGMFARLHVREAYTGTGIGLAIVQQVAERSDGAAWVEESPLGGCRFCITLPTVPGEAA